MFEIMDKNESGFTKQKDMKTSKPRLHCINTYHSPSQSSRPKTEAAATTYLELRGVLVGRIGVDGWGRGQNVVFGMLLARSVARTATALQVL